MNSTTIRRYLLIAAIAVAVCASAVTVGIIATQGTRSGSGGKQSQACQSAHPDQTAAQSEPLDLDDSNDSVVIDFGAGRTRRLDMVEIRAEDPLPASWNEFRANIGILSFDNKRELQGEGLVASARRVSRDTIAVSLCVDPDIEDIKPGTYQGVLHLSDERIEDMEIPVTVHAQDENSWKWLVLALAGGMIASIVAYRIHGRPERAEKVKRNSQFLPLLILITVGFGAALYRAVDAYNQDRAWGATPWDGLLLLAQTIPLGYGATVGVSDILKQLGASPTQIPSDAGETTTSHPTKDEVIS